MRQRAFDRSRHSITTNHGLRFNVQSRIGAQARGEINQSARDLVGIIPKVQSAARRRDATFDDRIFHRTIKLQGDRSHDVAEVVMHEESIAAFDAQFVEVRCLHKLELAALFDRGLRTLVDQLRKIDIFCIFGSYHHEVAADELPGLIGWGQIPAKFQVSGDRRSKIRWIIERDFVAVNVNEKLRDGKARESGAAAYRNFPTTQGAFESFDLSLAGVEQDCSLQIRKLDSLISEKYRDR